MLVLVSVLGLQSYYNGRNALLSSEFPDNRVHIFSLQFA